MSGSNSNAQTLLLTCLFGVDGYLFQADQASRRWTSPGGIEVAVGRLDAARRILSQTAWPAEMAEAVAELAEAMAMLLEALRQKDFTGSNVAQGRVRRAGDRFRQEGLGVLLGDG